MKDLDEFLSALTEVTSRVVVPAPTEPHFRSEPPRREPPVQFEAEPLSGSRHWVERVVGRRGEQTNIRKLAS